MCIRWDFGACDEGHGGGFVLMLLKFQNSAFNSIPTQALFSESITISLSLYQFYIPGSTRQPEP